ncbi:unnamed protein product [Merluccius merluccius]
MYQLPVENIDKIRKSRKKVKNILSELGLEDCQNLLKDLREKSEDKLDEDEAFENTEWEDFTEEDSNTKKKWPYRSQILCCALCKYSTRNIYTFKGHVSRSHDYEYSACALDTCPDCHYVGHPRALRKHIRFFHTSPGSLSSPNTATREWPQSSQKERYLCRKCGYPSSSLTAIKKHVILRHLESLAQQFIGYKMQPYGKIYICKICKSNMGTLDQMLHHMLTEPAHSWVNSQLIDHLKEHHPKTTANCDLLRQEYRVYTDGSGQIMFPYFDITTTAPKELLGDMEINLVLVTSSLDLIFLKMLPSSTHPDICQASVKISSACCPFCFEKFQNPAKHLQHLKQKHFVAPTVHAILKTEAFKCVYCNGVYTGKLTQQAVMLHLQRCRSSPKRVPEPLKISAGNQVPACGMAVLQPIPTQIERPKLFFQIPQQIHMKQLPAFTPAPPPKPPTLLTLVPTNKTTEVTEEQHSKRRLEEAWKRVVETNRREREQMAAKCKKRREEKMAARMLPTPESSHTKLLLEPTVLEGQSPWERKQFIFRYFNLNPYITKVESEELCKRLNLNKSELGAYFGNRRTKCLKSLRRSTAKVLLGFKMTELRKVKHNLFIPEIQPVEQVEKHKETKESRTRVQATELDRVDAVQQSSKMADSNIAPDTNEAVTEEVEKMET